VDLDIQDSPTNSSKSPTKSPAGQSETSTPQTNGSSKNTTLPQSSTDTIQSPQTATSLPSLPSRTAQFACVVRLIRSLDDAPPESQIVMLRLAITKGTPSAVWWELEVDNQGNRGILQVKTSQLTERKFLLPKDSKIKARIFGSSEFFPESKACESSVLSPQT
jgi:hypothetical protein